MADFHGLPLIAHSINYALVNSRLVDKVYVSINDTEIAEIVLKFGAQLIERPENLNGDLELTVTALKHALVTINFEPENIILLQPTNLLRPENLLRECFHKFKEGYFDSAMTVTRNHQEFGKIIGGNFEPFNYTFGQRSQDLEPLYFENGFLYITKADRIREGIICDKKQLALNSQPSLCAS